MNVWCIVAVAIWVVMLSVGLSGLRSSRLERRIANLERDLRRSDECKDGGE